MLLSFIENKLKTEKRKKHSKYFKNNYCSLHIKNTNTKNQLKFKVSVIVCF